MEQTCLAATIEPAFLHVGILGADGALLGAAARMTVDEDEMDDAELLFGAAPASVVELPEGGCALAGAPQLTVVGSEGPDDIAETVATARVRIEASRQALQGMLRAAS